MKVVWDKSYSIGVKMFDEEHKKLFEMINTLDDSLEHGMFRKGIDLVKDGLLEYVVNHFMGEEQLMRSYHYPEYEQHAKEHRKTMRKITALMDIGPGGSGRVAGELMDYLILWREKHVKVTDSRLGEFLKNKGVE